MELKFRSLKVQSDEVTGKISREFEDNVIQVENITEFGISAREEWKRNGDFKKFFKIGWIREEGKIYSWINVSTIAELKTILKGKFTSSHETTERGKRTRYGLQSRKGTSWSYKIKKENV